MVLEYFPIFKGEFLTPWEEFIHSRGEAGKKLKHRDDKTGLDLVLVQVKV